ncbi:MAG: alpha/beta fold hydrolase [Candidatus Zixiibacteriota bacterium]
MDTPYCSRRSSKRVHIGTLFLAVCLFYGSAIAAKIGKYETIEVAFDAPDTSVELVGYLSLPPAYKTVAGPAPLVVLLHQQSESSEVWNVFREELLQTGLAVFAMDLRGNGLSIFDLKTQRVRAKNSYIVGEQLRFPDDVKFLVNKAIEVHGSKFDATRIGVVGADLGGTVGLMYALREPRVKYVCVVSPGMEYQGLRILPVLREFDDRPILFASSDKDVYSMGSIDLITDLLPRALEVQIVESMFHGNRLINSSIPLRIRILQDLAKYLIVSPEKAN